MYQQDEQEDENESCKIKNIEARLADLIIYRDQARRRIAELEATVNTLLETAKNDAHSSVGLCRCSSAPLLDQPFKESGMQQIAQWNRELVETVNELRSSMLKIETDAKMQIIVLKDKMEQLHAECELLRCENDALKERVADDVLRQRQANRVEIAFERAKNAARVRKAGLCRLESMEAVLMETHDDIYYVQRFDAAKLPVRDVTFVMHIVANDLQSQVSGEEFTMDIYRRLLLSAARQHKGYHVCSVRQMEVFAFHSATLALNFSGACHLALTKLTWPYRTTEIPHFAPVIEDGEVLFSGPRVHTCIYTCNPGSEVDPINGRSIYYGEEVRQAILTALNAAPVGEIVANRNWGKLFCEEANIVNDKKCNDVVNVNCVREKIGSEWSIVVFDSKFQELFCSIIPKALEKRRQLPPYSLHFTPRFPHGVIDVDALLSRVIYSMKGVKNPSFDDFQQANQQHVYQEGWIDGIYNNRHRFTENNDPNCADLLLFYKLRREKANMISLYKKVSTTCEFYEQAAMEAEDGCLAGFKFIDPTETLVVCAVDIGDNALWRQVTNTLLDADEHYHLRDTLQSAVFCSGEKCGGIYVRGNNNDIFVFAFRRSEKALRFAADVYTVLSKNYEKFSGLDVCPMRAGISMGTLRLVNEPSSTTVSSSFVPLTSSGRSVDRGKIVICSGAAINIACKLCVSAKFGEILAIDNVVQSFYATKTNLLGMEYNIRKEGGRFLGSHSTLVDVHSVLPKLYASRRQECATGNQALKQWTNNRRFSFTVVLRPENTIMHCEDVRHLMLQQQHFIERMEAASMTLRDEFTILNPQQALCMPWPVISSLRNAQHATTTKTKTRAKTTKLLGFLFCDATEISAIARATSEELYRDVMLQYNHIVKEAVLEHDGFVAKTDSKSAYIVIFNEPHRAMETALQIQRRLLEFWWSSKLHTIDATLYVRSAKSGIALFRGVRARMAVHVSSDYQYTSVGRGAESTFLLLGPALHYVAKLGYQACGGEILLTQQAMTNIQSTLHGSLLLNQLAFCVASLQTEKQEPAVASCVPRQLIERFDLFRPVAGIGVIENKSRITTSKLRSGQKVGAQQPLWWQDENNPKQFLPPSRNLQAGKARGSLRHSTHAIALKSLEEAVGHIRQATLASNDLGLLCDNLMISFCDIINGISGIFKMLDDSSQKLSMVTAAAGPNSLSPATQHSDMTSFMSSTAPSVATKKLTATDAFGRPGTVVNLTNKSSLVTVDVYRRALLMLDEILKGVLQRIGRVLCGGGNVMSEQALPSLRQGNKKYMASSNLKRQKV